MRNQGVSGFMLRHQGVVRGVFTFLVFFMTLTGYGEPCATDAGIGREAEFAQLYVNHGAPLGEQRGKHHGMDCSAFMAAAPVAVPGSDFSSHRSVAQAETAAFTPPSVLLLRTITVTSDL
jgi:hypothetical protein